jgi:hypothetical protein
VNSAFAKLQLDLASTTLSKHVIDASAALAAEFTGMAKLGKGNEMKQKIKKLAWWFALLLGVAANIYFIYVATTHSPDTSDDDRPAFSVY